MGRHKKTSQRNVNGTEGQTNEGPLGYIFNAQQNESTEIWRCRDTKSKYLISIDKQECTNNGFMVEGSLGFSP